MDFVDQHRDRVVAGRKLGIEPICTVLTEHGCPIAPSTYYSARDRGPSRRRLRDEELMKLIEAERAHKFTRLLGARKMWLRLRGKGHDVSSNVRNGT